MKAASVRERAYSLHLEAVPFRAVEIDEVGVPRAVVEIDQERRVTRHVNVVGVAFEHSHERGLANRAAQVAPAAPAGH